MSTFQRRHDSGGRHPVFGSVFATWRAKPRTSVNRNAQVAPIGTIEHLVNEGRSSGAWLHELSIDMFPEDGCLHVYNGKDDAVTTFTDYGIEWLKQIIADVQKSR